MTRTCLSVLIWAVAATNAQDDPDNRPDRLLARAEKAANRGQYPLSVGLYRKLAKEHPATREGTIGARRSQPNAFLGSNDLVRTGASANRVDVVITGEGYTLDHQDLFDNIARTVPTDFERNDVFREYLSYFNFIRANVVSHEDGVDEFDRRYDTAMGGHRTGGIQGQVGVDGRLVRSFLDELPEHDALAVVFVKLGLLGTGGGGVAAVGGRSDKTLIHEWGHAFAGLGDEYSANTGHRGEVGRSPNVANTGDRRMVPWHHWLDRHVPEVGVYQGAAGQAQGAWKPTNYCLMGDGEQYCPVCREALVLRTYQLVDPIDACVPAPHPSQSEAFVVQHDVLIRDRKPIAFEIKVMRPRTHEIHVRFWVLPRREVVPARAVNLDARPRAPGVPVAIEAEPVYSSLDNPSGVHQFTLEAERLEPGVYTIICRAEDPTRVRGERLPWVLLDAAGVLTSERRWNLIVK